MNTTSPPHPIPIHEPILVSRIADVLSHSSALAFKGTSKLLAESGLSRTGLFRLIRGGGNPSYHSVLRVTSALESLLGRSLDPRELIALNGNFPTAFVCFLMGCTGCLPDAAFDTFGSLTHTYADIKPGHWVSSLHPRGL